jgi:hypothetical protein
VDAEHHQEVGEAEEGGTREFLAGVDHRAQRLLGCPGGEYEVGIELMGYVMLHLETDETAGGLYLIWGSLTDWIDGPRAEEPGARDAALASMRRCASEWLEVERTRVGLRIWLDRWVYDECGYERKPGG